MMSLAQELQDRIFLAGVNAYHKWGPQAELIKTVEECSELAVVLSKSVGGSPVDSAAIIDEIADVLIMVLRLRDRHGPRLVDERIRFKLDRLEKHFKPVSSKEGQPPEMGNNERETK